MEETRTRSVVLPDIRGEGRSLRITWHPTTSTVVFSHWNGSVCTASTPVSLAEASRVIDLLVGALRTAVSDASGTHLGPKREMTAISRVLGHLKPGLAPMVELRGRVVEEWRRRIAR